MRRLTQPPLEPSNPEKDYGNIPTFFTLGKSMNRPVEAAKLDRVNRAIEAQKLFIRTVPDPDNRERAEANLMSLVLQRDEYVDAQDAYLGAVLIK